jgi:hypothetical protein
MVIGNNHTRFQNLRPLPIFIPRSLFLYFLSPLFFFLFLQSTIVLQLLITLADFFLPLRILSLAIFLADNPLSFSRRFS